MRTGQNMLLVWAALAILAFEGCALAGGTDKAPDVRAEFESEYLAFRRAPQADPYMADPLTDERRQHLDNIIKLGPPVLPLLMEKLTQRRSTLLYYPISTITKKRFVADEWPRGKLGDSRGAVDLYLLWWQAGVEMTAARFERLYAEWKKLKAGRTVLGYYEHVYDDSSKGIWMHRRKETEAGELLDAIKALGIAALPCMIEKIKEGDYDMLPIIADLTDEASGRVQPLAIGTVEERAQFCLQWWEKNKDWWTINFCLGNRDIAETLKPPTDFVVPLQVEPVEREQISLNQEHLMFAQKEAGELRKIKVELRRTCYLCRILKVNGGVARMAYTRLQCYELDSEAPYTWSFWTGGILAHFRMFSDEKGQSYLAWVRGTNVHFADISKPRDRVVGLHQYSSGVPSPGVVYVPVGDLVPEAHSWGVNAFYNDITVLSILRNEAEGWVVTISSPSGEDIITLVCEKGKWRKERTP